MSLQSVFNSLFVDMSDVHVETDAFEGDNNEKSEDLR